MRLRLTNPLSNSLTTIDFLPETVQGPKRVRRYKLRLAAAQAAIFLCIVLAALVLGMLERRAWDNTHRLALRISYLRHGPEVMAVAQARDMHARLAAAEAFLEDNMPEYFDALWVAAVLEADTGYMTSLDYGGVRFMLTGITDSMDSIEAHRQGLLDTGMFESVLLGRIIMQDDGRLFYELRVVVGRQ